MTKRRTILKGAAGAAGVLGLLVLLGAALAPRWINLAPVRGRIEAAASSAAGGTVRYGRLDLSWWPRPEVVVRDLELSAAGKARGSVRSVSVSPAFLPLLRGRFVLTRVVLDGPDLTVEIPEPATEDRPERSDGPFEILRSLVPEGRELAVELRDGRAVLTRGGGTLAAVHGLGVRIGLAAKGREMVRAEVRLLAPAVSFARGDGRSLAVDGLRVEGTADFAAGRSDVALSRLSAGSPRFLVSGTFGTDAAVPRAGLAVRGEGLDLGAVRGKLLPFAGDVPVLAAIFAIVRAGTIPAFSLDSRGRTPGDLGVFERMSIRASLSGGSLRIESAGLDFGSAAGEVSIEGGVLTAEKVAAVVGRSRASEGSVLVGLGKGDDRLRVEARVRADLSELPGLLSRVVTDRAFLDELSLVEGLEGSAEGSIAIEGRMSSLDTTVAVSGMSFSARYQRIPWPLRVAGGSFSFDGTRIGLGGLAGSVGSSTFSGLAARVRLAGSTAIEELSGTFEAPLAELYSGLASGEGTESLRRTVRHLSGTARVTVSRLSGPFLQPREWSVEAAGTVAGVRLDASFLPGPLEVAAGQFGVDPETVRLTGFDLRAIDASLVLSGAVRGYRSEARTVEATLDGTVGPEGVRRVWQRAALPAGLLPTAPLHLAGVRLGLPRPGELTLAGTFTAARGARVTLDLVSGPGGTSVQDLTIADGDLLSSMSLLREGEGLGIRFQGRLDGTTVAKLLEGRPEARGRIEGDLRAHLPDGGIGEATAEGRLSVSDITLPTPAGELAVERLDLQGAGGGFTVASSSFVLADQRFSASGSASVRGEGVDLDLDVSTGDLDWARVEGVVDRIKENEKGPAPAAGSGSGVEAGAPEGTGPFRQPAPPLAVGGALRVSLDSFRYDRLTWAPVLLDVRLEGNSASATVRKAELCGFSTTGTARFLPDGTVAVEAAVVSAGPDVGVPLACLGLGDGRITGPYEASARAAARGEASQLLRSAHGPLAFRATEGSLGKVSVLTRILGVLNATEVFAGKDGGRVGEAMPFKELRVEGELGDGAVSIREATLSTKAFTLAASGRVGLDGTLDLMVLSQPLSTLNKVVRAVPVVRTILGGDFLSVAARVTGTAADPKTRITPGRDVGLGLVRILERTVKLPVTVFDPPPGREPAAGDAPQ